MTPLPAGFVPLDEILGDRGRWPDATRIDAIDWYINVGPNDPPRRVRLVPTATIGELTTLGDLREGAQRIVEGAGLIRVRDADSGVVRNEPRAFVIARVA